MNQHSSYNIDQASDQISRSSVKRRSFLRNPIVLTLLGLMVVSVIFLVGMGAGFGLSRASANTGVPEASQVGLFGDAGDRASAEDELGDDFDVFWEAMGLLYRDFYGDLPDGEIATYGAIEGVLNLLDDPNTSFLRPEDAEFFRSSIEGTFEGIGARVDWDEELKAVVIVEPFEDQPAWKAGLRRGDLILAIDDETTADMGLSEAVSRIRGDKGSTVVLSVLSEGDLEARTIEVVRDEIEIPTIRTDTLGEEENIGYVELNTFNENAGRLVRQAVEDAVENDAEALIFDLRGNAGGLLREAIKVTSIFQEDGRVLIERFSDGSEEIFETEGRAVAPDIPLVVLVNEGSASASEIVAGSLQDHERATLVGTTTFGKGSVQLPHTLSNNGIMRVTIARWFTPDDRTIDGNGLEPDVLIERTLEQIEAGEDPQLDAAIMLLEQQIEGQTASTLEQSK